MSKWMVKMKKADFDAIAGKFGINRITARLLTNRGLTDDEEIERFLSGKLAAFHSMMLLVIWAWEMPETEEWILRVQQGI